jgi:hypothetical protein
MVKLWVSGTSSTGAGVAGTCAGALTVAEFGAGAGTITTGGWGGCLTGANFFGHPGTLRLDCFVYGEKTAAILSVPDLTPAF